MNITKDTLKELTIDDIIQWCAENKKTAWLKAKAKETVEQPIYPEIEVVNETTGAKKKKANKKAEPIGTKIVPIPYVNIKRDWVKEFFPELAPTKKAKKQTMWEIIAALPDDE